MTSPTGFDRVSYFQFTSVGNSEQDICEIQANFNQIQIDPTQGEYVCSVEKMIVPLHGMTFIEDITDACWFVSANPQATVFDYGGNSFNNRVSANNTWNLKNISSLTDIIEQLSAVQVDGELIKICLTPSGRVKISNGKYATWHLVLSRQLQNWFGLPQKNEYPVQIGNYSVANRIDRVKRITLTSFNLATLSEISDNNNQTKEITSIDITTDYTSSVTYNQDDPAALAEFSFGFQPRQDIILEPKYPRFINLKGVPIDQMYIKAFAECLTYVPNGNTVYVNPQPTNNTGTWVKRTEAIKLPIGARFSLKLAFWKRK